MSILLFAEGFCGYKVHVLSQEHGQLKRDYSVINNVSFGLLSVSKWRELIETAITRRIADFSLTAPQRDSLKLEINNILYALIDKAYNKIIHADGSLGKKIKGLALKTFIDKDNIKKQVPDFSETILDKLQAPASKKRLKHIAKNKLEELGEETYDSSKITELTVTDSLLKKYEANDIHGFNQMVSNSLHHIKTKTYIFCSVMFVVVLAFPGLWWFLRNRPYLLGSFYILSIIAALILLLVGLTTTMIEIDARIQSLNFHLLGVTITFKDQVLFFQSKSIWDIVIILMDTGRLDSMLVGFMILCFSILFPMSKLVSAVVYLLSTKKWSKNKVIHFFAFKSGKWSTADVMVVAIFMAYIGFNGVIKDQLSSLNIRSETLTTITSNQTSLQPGYIVFIMFVLFGLALSEMLHKTVTPSGQP